MNDPNMIYPHTLGGVQVWIGPLGVQRIELTSRIPVSRARPPDNTDGASVALWRALERYFSGEREEFEAVPLDLAGHTPFRRAVWKAARRVGWGSTVTYGTLCAAMGRDLRSARAVGQALGANPIPIIIPCHRILAAEGKLGGFSGGLPWKRALLELEGPPLNN